MNTLTVLSSTAADQRKTFNTNNKNIYVTLSLVADYVTISGLKVLKVFLIFCCVGPLPG